MKNEGQYIFKVPKNKAIDLGPMIYRYILIEMLDLDLDPKPWFLAVFRIRIDFNTDPDPAF